MNEAMDKKDEILMRLVHYFITEENYQPIIVNGVKNEVWLENLDAPYKVVRINSNYIHNEDQLKFDNYKIMNITKQIKKKTFSFKIKTLNILLDLNEGVTLPEEKNIDIFKVNSLKDIRQDDNLGGLFPKLKTMTINPQNDFNSLLSITSDISVKNEKENEEFENVFKPKKIVVTPILIILNIALFFLTIGDNSLLNHLILNPIMVKAGEYYRLVTCMFLHGNILHLSMNCYALKIIGTQMETYLGKTKFLLIYFISGIIGALTSCIVTNSLSLGASGAIFGLTGAMLYFGYHYRLFLGNVLLNQIVPVIVINIIIGFTISGIDNAAHIGGLVGGLLTTMALGVNKKDSTSTKINGYITLTILITFLCYILFFIK